MIMLYFVMRQRPTGVTRTYTRLPYTTLFRSLYVLTLGGDNEIGRNLNLYGYGDQWLMVDLGTSFADEGMPGVDMVVPDVTWIAGRRKKLLGIVLTHAHEDHLGAISHLWDELQCPIWATGFAASVLRRKLEIGRAHV